MGRLVIREANMAKKSVQVMSGPDDVPEIVETILIEERKQLCERFIALAADTEDWKPEQPAGTDYTDQQRAEIVEALKRAIQLAFSIAATVVVAKPMPELKVAHLPVSNPGGDHKVKETVH
jgi:hypothetical protein